MARLYRKIDYSNATDVIKNSLSPLKDSLSNLSSIVLDYCSIANNELSGEAYNIIINNLNLFSDKFKFFGNSIDIFINNAVSANNAVINALGEFDSVSDKELDELKKELLGLKIKIAIKKKNSKNNTSKDATTSDDDENSKDINSYYETLSILEQKIEKIEKALSDANSADSNGVGGITDIENIISKFNDCYIQE